MCADAVFSPLARARFCQWFFCRVFIKLDKFNESSKFGMCGKSDKFDMCDISDGFVVSGAFVVRDVVVCAMCMTG